MRPATTLVSAIIRILAVFFASSLLWATPRVIQTVIYTDGSWIVYPIVAIAEVLFYLYVAIYSDKISGWLAVDSVKLTLSDTFTPQTLSRIILSCIGIYILINELPGTLHWLLDYDYIKIAYLQVKGIDGETALLVQIAQGIFKIVFGLVLIFGSKHISAFLNKIGIRG